MIFAVLLSLVICVEAPIPRLPPGPRLVPRKGQMQMIKAAPRNFSMVPVELKPGSRVVMRPTAALLAARRNATIGGWTHHPDGTVRLTDDDRFALTANFTKESWELTFRVFLWRVLHHEHHGLNELAPDQQRWMFHEPDSSLRLLRYPDSVLGVNWWSRVADGVEVCYFASSNGLHHKVNREWYWPELGAQGAAGSAALDNVESSWNDLADAFFFGFVSVGLLFLCMVSMLAAVVALSSMVGK